MKYKLVFEVEMVPNLIVEREILKEANYNNEYDMRIASIQDGSFFDEIKNADGVCGFLPYTKDVLEIMEKCQVVALPALGADYIYKEPATELGICMTNASPYCIDEVATHTVALILDSVRRIARQDRYLKAGNWDWSQRGKLYRLSNCTYGQISFGNIAQRTNKMMKGFGVKSQAFDPYLPDSVFNELGVKRVDSLEEIFYTSDIISVHTPALSETYHMIGKRQFGNIPKNKGIIFVVTSRGGVVDESSLKIAIEDGRVVSAGLDVIEDEIKYNSVLTNMNEVTITPHMAYYSEDSAKALRRINFMDILDVLEHKRLPQNLVNKDVAGKARFQQYQE